MRLRRFLWARPGAHSCAGKSQLASPGPKSFVVQPRLTPGPLLRPVASAVLKNTEATCTGEAGPFLDAWVTPGRGQLDFPPQTLVHSRTRCPSHPCHCRSHPCSKQANLAASTLYQQSARFKLPSFVLPPCLVRQSERASPNPKGTQSVGSHGRFIVLQGDSFAFYAVAPGRGSSLEGEPLARPSHPASPRPRI